MEPRAVQGTAAGSGGQGRRGGTASGSARFTLEKRRRDVTVQVNSLQTGKNAGLEMSKYRLGLHKFRLEI